MRGRSPQIIAMWTLPESEAAPLENHLLVCRKCRDRLEATDAYVVAMRSASATKIRQRGKGDQGRCGHRGRRRGAVGPPGKCDASGAICACWRGVLFDA